MALDNTMDGLFALPKEGAEEPSGAPTPASPRDAEPTPMPSSECGTYFAPREISPNPPVEIDPVELLIRAIDSAALVQHASTAKFISWRRLNRSLESSITSSMSPTSSSSDISGPVPMPTVARAQGGGEWEAGLSRRVAQRKEVHHIYRGRMRRRTSRSPEKPACHPLFPQSASKTTSTGLSRLKDSIFKPMTAMWTGQTGWKKAVLICAVVAVVGWSCWGRFR